MILFSSMPEHACQVPNEIRMNYERLHGGELLRYVGKRRQTNIYRAAARLWGRGVSWNEAISIVTEAFDQSMAIWRLRVVQRLLSVIPTGTFSDPHRYFQQSPPLLSAIPTGWCSVIPTITFSDPRYLSFSDPHHYFQSLLTWHNWHNSIFFLAWELAWTSPAAIAKSGVT